MDPNITPNQAPGLGNGQDQQQPPVVQGPYPPQPNMQPPVVVGTPSPTPAFTQGQQQPSFMPSNAPVAMDSNTGGFTPQEIKRRKLPLLLGGGIILIILIIAAYFVFKPSSSPQSSSGSGASSSSLASQLQLLKQYGNNLQAANLSSFNKTALFYAVFKNAAMQPVLHALSDHYEGGSATDQSTRAYEFLHDTTFNYATKAYTGDTQDPGNTFNERCVSGKNYAYSTVNVDWEIESGSSGDCSAPTDYDTDINDGVNAGGMSDTQAQAFVSGMANASGLISVDSMTYVTHAGAPYIRLQVTVNPVNTSLGYEGMGAVGGAFKLSGLDELSWPYETIGTIATGAKFIYYVNPSTQLPAYSQTGLTYYLDDAGHQQQDHIYDFQDTQYGFGGAVTPLPLTGAPQKISLSWPEEKM